MKRDRELSAPVIEGMIADGHAIVIFEDLVLRLDSWLDKHPGGRLVVLHMVGRDATDEMHAYHSPSTLKIMKAFRIGRKPPGIWTNNTPPIRGGVYRKQDDGRELTAPPPPPLDHTTDPNAADSPSSSSSSGDTTSDAGSPLASSITSVSEAASCTGAECRDSNGARIRASAATSGGGHESTRPAIKHDIHKRLSPNAYADWAVRQELEEEMRNYPSIEPAVQQDIVRRYRLLHQRAYDEGLYLCNYLAYGQECLRYGTLFGLFLLALRSEWFLTAAVLLGAFWHQIMFTAHDAGHRAITANFHIDTAIGIFIADFCCGLSIGWWKSSHNVHHLVTNMPEHDPDIQNIPLFATSPSFFKSLHSSYYDFTFIWDATAQFLVPYQQYTYYPVMAIARFNLYLLSWLHVLSGRSSGLGGSKAWWIRPSEVACMLCYWYMFGYQLLWRTLPSWTLRVVFVLVSHIATMPLHVQITLSHWGMPTSELGESESFPQRQLRTSMDVDCPAWLDFIHGGLQFQAVHHLFPRVPRHNLRRLQVLVRDFCQETGIPYSILGFVNGNKKVLSRLEEVGDQVKILVKCQKFMAETRESGLAH